MTTTPKDTLKGNKPKPFTGDRSTLDDFVTDCQLYLSISAPKAEGASKKPWILTFIQGGEAAGWKNQYISSPDYAKDTYDQFLARFVLTFKDPQEKVNARIALSRLWQNNLQWATKALQCLLYWQYSVIISLTSNAITSK